MIKVHVLSGERDNNLKRLTVTGEIRKWKEQKCCVCLGEKITWANPIKPFLTRLQNTHSLLDIKLGYCRITNA